MSVNDVEGLWTGGNASSSAAAASAGPWLRGLTTERRRVDFQLFGESRQPSDKQTWLKRHLRIEHLAGRVQQGLLDSTELAVHALHITPSSGVGPELSRAALICRRTPIPGLLPGVRAMSCTVASRTASRPPAAAKHRSYPAITAAHTRVSRAGPQLSPLASDQPSFLRHDIPAVRSMSRAFLPPRRSLRPRAVSALREPA